MNNVFAGALAATMLVAATSASALPVVFDDFNDGDGSDWTFFGGISAGGGGGVAADKPKEGSHYFSTRWSGEGTNSIFYGGAFKNVANASQPVPPADPWLNVWVLNDSSSTVEEYVLEVTVREDLDGNGWTDGSEDTFRLDTKFTSSEFDDAWTLVSAPLADFLNLATGGNGVFDGKVDEVVIVISQVKGASGSQVNVAFDQIAFTSGGPLEGVAPAVPLPAGLPLLLAGLGALGIASRCRG